MGKINVIETGLEGLLIIEPKVFGDSRGFFLEFYNKREFEEAGIKKDFVQDNHSKSGKNVLRGLHFQNKHPQGKLVRAIRGTLYDVVVDLRKDSKTYKKSYGIELSEQNKKMLYIPEGFAHGFLALSEETEINYKATDYYYPEYDAGLRWNDKEINVDWGFSKYGIKEEELILSEKDRKLPFFDELEIL